MLWARFVIERKYERGTVTATLQYNDDMESIENASWQSDDECFQMLVRYYAPRVRRKHAYSPWPARDTSLALAERVGGDLIEAYHAPTPPDPPGTIY